MKVNIRHRLSHTLLQSVSIIILSCVVGLIVNFFRSDGLALSGTWSPEQQLSNAHPGLSISVEEAEVLFNSGSAVCVDARSRADYDRGHIRGALSLPWQDAEQGLADVMEVLFDNPTIITYCDGDTCSVGKDLALFLIEAGFTDVRVLINGWSLWQENSLPVE